MSVEVALYGIVGIKKDYNEFLIVDNKNCIPTDDEKEEYNNIIYQDYLPNNYVAEVDGMCGEYSFVGKKIFIEDELYDGLYCEIDQHKLENETKEVYTVLKSLNIKCEESDIKLHIFTHFY